MSTGELGQQFIDEAAVGVVDVLAAQQVVMKLSTRNQLDGTVTAITRGEAMAVIRVRLNGGDEMTSSITRAAADDLGLAEGSAVKVLVKSTEVTLRVE